MERYILKNPIWAVVDDNGGNKIAKIPKSSVVEVSQGLATQEGLIEVRICGEPVLVLTEDIRHHGKLIVCESDDPASEKETIRAESTLSAGKA